MTEHDYGSPDGKDINPESVTTDDLDMKDADFIETGQFVPLLSYTGADRSIGASPSSYGNEFRGLHQVHFNPNNAIGQNGQLAVYLAIRALPGTDETASIQLFDGGDSEVVAEQTGISSNTDVEILQDWNPTTRDQFKRIDFRAKTDPGNNNLILFGITVAYGLQL